MNFRFSRNSLNRMEGVDQRLIEIASLAISLTKVDFGIPRYGGLRTQEEQQYLYSKGVSNADGIENVSNHQKGIALDVFAYVNGEANWEEYNMAMVATAMLQAASQLGYKLEWGGLWTTFIDMPHFQLSEESSND